MEGKRANPPYGPYFRGNLPQVILRSLPDSEIIQRSRNNQSSDANSTHGTAQAALHASSFSIKTSTQSVAS